ncbi:MAG: hypothetical protein LBV04_03795 [Deferribacteraceae bacterium]|jgi:hypothetical protein|nr:hypothetical protein [Deferribacteraceae bacterium]
MKKFLITLVFLVFSISLCFAASVTEFGTYKVGAKFENVGYKGHTLKETARNDTTIFYELDNTGYSFKDRITLSILVNIEDNTIRKMNAVEGNK